MEHTNTTNNTCACRNNYTEETFLESFGKDDNEIKKCNGCPNMEYDCGTMTCTKFN